jgi:hypothetical protein
MLEVEFSYVFRRGESACVVSVTMYRAIRKNAANHNCQSLAGPTDKEKEGRHDRHPPKHHQSPPSSPPRPQPDPAAARSIRIPRFTQPRRSGVGIGQAGAGGGPPEEVAGHEGS